MPTPHNQAKYGEIAKTVLMPGDPLRAKFIAEKYLENPKEFNTVRNMLGYTGTYRGKAVSVMGSGMGMPSIGIYSYELYSQYGVENIIRIGSAGSYCKELDVRDLVLVKSAFSESTFAKVQSAETADTLFPSGKLNEIIQKTAYDLNVNIRKAHIHSSDVFYRESHMDGYREIYEKHGCECVEMESFALFHNADVLGKRAACLLTVSDSFVSHAELSAEERQNSFDDMMRVALEAAIRI